ALVVVVYDSFDAMQVHLLKAEAEDRAHRLCHDALTPVGSSQFIAGLGAVESAVEKMEAAGADDLILALTRNAPPNTLTILVPKVLAPDQIARFVNIPLFNLPIIFHNHLV